MIRSKGLFFATPVAIFSKGMVACIDRLTSLVTGLGLAHLIFLEQRSSKQVSILDNVKYATLDILYFYAKCIKDANARRLKCG